MKFTSYFNLAVNRNYMKKTCKNMNKNLQSIPEPPQISMDYAGYVRLGSFWHKRHLSGPFWRFYHHDSCGAGLYTADGEKVEIRPDRCYILPPHCNRLTWCTGMPYQLYIHFELSMSTGNPRFPFHEIPLTVEMRPVLEELKHSLIRDKPDCLRNSLLSISLCSRALTLLPSEALLESETDRRMELTCNYLREHLANEVNLDTLAARVKMTPNAFSRLFRENTGVTPYQYLLQLRYNLASKLLHSDQHSIDEICEIVGVKDRFHFSRTFKKIYGVPPAQYRRNYASESSFD